MTCSFGQTRARRRRGGALVGGIGVGVDEDDRQRLARPCRELARPRGDLLPGRPASRTVPSASTRSSTSSRMSRSTTGMKSPHRPQVRGRSRRRISSTSRKPARRDQADARALALEQRVGADRRAVHDGAEIRDRGRARRRPVDEADAPRRRGARAPWRSRSVAVALVEPEEVGEGAADVDADDRGSRALMRVRAQAPSPRRRLAVVDCDLIVSRAAARDIAEPHVARDVAPVARRGSPQPPPPGVSSRTRWPLLIFTSDDLRGERRRGLAVVGRVTEKRLSAAGAAAVDAEGRDSGRARRAGRHPRRSRASASIS